MKHRPDPSRRLAALVLLLLLPLGIALGGCRHEPAEPEVWYCPMHPTYVADRPGTCPICNMDLVRQERPESAAPAAAAPAAGERRILHYRNPMDPTITSPVPAKDSMGMDYVPVYADEATPGAAPGIAGRAAVELSDEGMRLAGVRTEAARTGALERSIRTVGRVLVDERRLHRATTKIGGWVERLEVDFEGRAVRKGQPMLSIYSPELVASQEEYLLAKANAARFLASSIPEVRRGGDDQVAAARRRLQLFDVPEAFLDELDRTRKARRTVALVAPASGYVVEKSVVEGMQVEPGMALYTVADLSRVWVEADFYESEASAVRVGTPARLSLPYDREVAVEARAAFVYPELDAEARTVRVRFDVDNPGLRFKPGMFVDVEAETSPAPGILVPDSAVIDSGTRQVVFVETAPGRFEPREVRVEARAAGSAQLAPGAVAAGDRVVVKANFLLDSESRLRAALSAMAPGGSAEEAPPADPHAGHGDDRSEPGDDGANP